MKQEVMPSVIVLFEPGCRNNWHTHPAGQILLITDGKGFAEKRKTCQVNFKKEM